VLKKKKRLENLFMSRVSINFAHVMSGIASLREVLSVKNVFVKIALIA